MVEMHRMGSKGKSWKRNAHDQSQKLSDPRTASKIGQEVESQLLTEEGSISFHTGELPVVGARDVSFESVKTRRMILA